MDEIKKKLILIGSAEPGHTINTKTQTLAYHRNWYTSLVRTISREDALSTLLFIELTIDDTIQNLSSDFEYLPLLKEAKNGILSLKQTYAHESQIVERIELCIARIDNAIAKFEKQFISAIEQMAIMQELLKASEFDNQCLLVQQTPIRSTSMTRNLSFISAPISRSSFANTPKYLFTPKNETPACRTPLDANKQTPLISKDNSPMSTSQIFLSHQSSPRAPQNPVTPPSSPRKNQNPATPPSSPRRNSPLRREIVTDWQINNSCRPYLQQRLWAGFDDEGKYFFKQWPGIRPSSFYSNTLERYGINVVSNPLPRFVIEDVD